jgi:hypothetical protein
MKLGVDGFRIVTAYARLGDRPHINRRLSVFHGADGVLSMTIRAHGRFFDARRIGFSVNAFSVNVTDIFMTFATRIRNFGAIDFGQRIRGRMNIVRAMAVGANRGVYFPSFLRLPMHAVQIRVKRLALR